jgi:two-component sensor histidine kinase
MSLTHRLLALTLAASLPGLAAVGYGATDLRNTRYAEVRAAAVGNAHFLVAEIDQIFGGIAGTLHAVSQATEIRKDDPQACRDYVSRVRRTLEQLTSILILNLDGSVRCYSEDGMSPANLSDRDYFQQAIATRKFAIGTYTASRISRRNVVPVALPVLDGDTVTQVIAAGINVEWLGAQLRQRGIARGTTVTVADRNGIIISREPFPEQFIGTRFRDEFMPLIQGPSGSLDVRGRDGVDRILGYVPAHMTPFGLYVSTAISRAEAFGPIDRAVRNGIALIALGITIAFLLAWLVGESIIRRPLMRIVATAEAWRRGHDAARTGIIDRSDEIGILGQTFDRLMDENALREEQRATAEERREILVHELAHRVKNTLATVQSIASLSFRHSQGPEALRRFQDRLQALVRGHDLLTRKNWQHADLSEVAEAAMSPLREERGHRFTIAGPQVDLPPSTAVPMAMILHELCTNALKYGALSNDIGRVAINWTSRPGEQSTGIDLTWSEAGGPAVEPPSEEGFGTRLIANLCRQMGGDCDFQYPPSGLICRISIVSPKFEPRE